MTRSVSEKNKSGLLFAEVSESVLYLVDRDRPRSDTGLAAHRRCNGTNYLIDWEGGWTLLEATWEPIKNILTAKDELRAFEELAAAMPLRGAL